MLGLSVLAAFPTSCTCSVELIDSSIVVIVVVVHCDGLSVDDITVRHFWSNCDLKRQVSL